MALAAVLDHSTRDSGNGFNLDKAMRIIDGAGGTTSPLPGTRTFMVQAWTPEGVDISSGAGTADSAIQQCFDAALAEPDGANILIPPGNYIIAGAPTLTSPAHITVSGYGAKLTLTSAATFGIKLAGTVNDCSIRGIHVVGTGYQPVIADDPLSATGIGMVMQGTCNGTKLSIVDCEVEQVARGIIVDNGSLGQWSQVVIFGNKCHEIKGIYSHTGYGICMASGRDYFVYGNEVKACERHGVYVSVSTDSVVAFNKFLNHRASVTTGVGQFGACEIARSGGILVFGNRFDNCADGACSIEPHESDTAFYTRNIRIQSNVFRNSPNADIWIGNQQLPSTQSLLADVIVANNQIERPAGATNSNVPIYVYFCQNLQVNNNQIRANNAYTVSFSAIYLAGSESWNYTHDVHIEDNDFEMTSGVAGATFGVEIGTNVCTGSSEVSVRHRTWRVTGNVGRYMIPDATITNPNISVDDRRGDQGIFVNRGDTSVTLTPLDTELVYFNSPLTGARTVTLPTSDVFSGRSFTVLRTAASTGAFTIDVGGLKTIPSATAARVDVEYDGAAWRLVGYQTL